MDILLLRLVHIGAGAFWLGAVFTFFLFVQPAAVAVGPDGTRFTHRLLQGRLPIVILGAAATTVVAGIWLLAVTSNGLDPDVLLDVSRLGFTVGGLVAIVTFGIGALYVFPRTMTVKRTLGRLVADARPPTPDEQATLMRAGRESRRAGWVVLAGLTIAIACMATARLWGLVL